MRAAQSASAAGSRCAKRANASRIDLCHRGQGRWRPSAIDAGLDLSRQSAGAKHQRWLLAQNRQKICTFQPLHRAAPGLRPSRPARRLAVLAGRLSARLQMPRLRRPALCCSTCSQQLQDPAVPPLENLGFRTLAHETELTNGGRQLFNRHRTVGLLKDTECVPPSRNPAQAHGACGCDIPRSP